MGVEHTLDIDVIITLGAKELYYPTDHWYSPIARTGVTFLTFTTT
jgi:hypothetical protein